MKNQMNLILSWVLLTLLIFGCKRDEPIHKVSEIQFTLKDEYLYSQSNLIIYTNTKCNIDNVKVMIENKEAEIVTSNDQCIVVKIPDFFKDTVSLSIQDQTSQNIIREKIKVYPSSLAFEELSLATYDTRTVFQNFMVNGKGCIYGGYTYFGYDANKIPQYNEVIYDDIWEYNNDIDGWNKLSSVGGLSANDQLKFFNANQKIIINNEVYIANTAYKTFPRTDSSIFKLEKFNFNNNQWETLCNQNFKGIYEIPYIFYDNNKLNIGIHYGEGGDELWAYDLEKHTFTYLYYLGPFGTFTWLDFIFKHGSSLFLYLNSSHFRGPDEVGLDGPQLALYIFNTELNKLQVIKLDNNVPIKSVNASPAFNYGDYGIIGEGIAVAPGGSLFTYSNRYFKVRPK